MAISVFSDSHNGWGSNFDPTIFIEGMGTQLLLYIDGIKATINRIMATIDDINIMDTIHDIIGKFTIKMPPPPY